MSLIIFGLIFIGLIAYFFIPKSNKDQSPGEDYFFSTEGQTDERVKALHLDKPSEDASHILDTSKLVFPRIKTDYEVADYQSDPELEWVINLNLKKDLTITKGELEKLFDLDWRSNFPSMIYGYSTEEKRWTYILAGDSPDRYSKIQVGINLLEVYGEDPTLDQQKLEKYFTTLKKKIESYPGKFDIESSESPHQALVKAKGLIDLNEAFNQYAIIVLRSNKPYRGIDAWDALLSVGLKWGDGDLFHWNNVGSDFGHDQHFSVWTTTEPGYFLPESIKDGQMNPTDLVFGFSIPRSADPKNIFDAMLNAAKYCQKRLGGTILDKNEQPFHEQREQEFVTGLVDGMQSQGVVPGSTKALKTFH